MRSQRVRHDWATSLFTYVLSILKYTWVTVYIFIISLFLEFKFYLLAEFHILIVPFPLSPKIVQKHFIPSIYLPEMIYSLTLYSKEKELSFFHHNFFPFSLVDINQLFFWHQILHQAPHLTHIFFFVYAEM